MTRPVCEPIFTGRPAARSSSNFSKFSRRQILVIILVDLDHRGIAAGSQTFDFDPGEHAVRRNFSLLANSPKQNFLDRVGAGEQARRRAAHLDIEPSDRREIEHRVESSDFEHPDKRHAKLLRDLLDRRFRQPIIVLLLRKPQQRDHRGSLAAFRIFLQDFLAPCLVFAGEGEGFRLVLGETANGHRFSSLVSWLDGRPRMAGRFESPEGGRRHHRSTSPKTISIEPKIALTSASIDLRQRKSIAARCAKPGALILQRYGLLVPSETR